VERQAAQAAEKAKLAQAAEAEQKAAIGLAKQRSALSLRAATPTPERSDLQEALKLAKQRISIPTEFHMPLGRRAVSAAALSATLAGVPSPLPAATLAPPSLAHRLATPRSGRLELLKPDPKTSRPDTLHCSVVKTALLAAIPSGQPSF
jgi:hypothetical protein